MKVIEPYDMMLIWCADFQRIALYKIVQTGREFMFFVCKVDIQRLLQLATPPSSTQGWSIKQSL